MVFSSFGVNVLQIRKPVLCRKLEHFITWIILDSFIKCTIFYGNGCTEFYNIDAWCNIIPKSPGPNIIKLILAYLLQILE